MSEPRFFIGWEGRTGFALGSFLALLVGLGLGVLAALGMELPRSGADHAPPGFGGTPPGGLAEGPQRLEGVLTALPYPLLHLPGGQTVLLAGEGKLGAPAAQEGQRVAAEGYLGWRGSIAMLTLAAAPMPLGEGVPPARQPLGRWRITGEVCDGKCAAGVMRPGTGLAHRACANLCVAGEIPAVFVPTAPVAGEAFLVLGDAAGRGSPSAWRDVMGLRVTLEGEVARLGSVLVFQADPAGARQ